VTFLRNFLRVVHFKWILFFFSSLGAISAYSTEILSPLGTSCSLSPKIRRDWILPPPKGSERFDQKYLFTQSVTPRYNQKMKSSYQKETDLLYYYGEKQEKWEESQKDRRRIMRSHFRDMMKFHLVELYQEMKTSPRSSTLGKVYHTQKSIENASRVKIEFNSDVRMKGKFNFQTLSSYWRLQNPYLLSEVRFYFAPSLYGDEFDKNNPVNLRLEKEFLFLNSTARLRYGLNHQIYEFEWAYLIDKNWRAVLNSQGTLKEQGEGVSLQYAYSF